VPFIECHITVGLTQDRRNKLIRDIIQVTHDSIGSDPKIINVVLHEHPTGNLSVSSRIDGGEFKSKTSS
jgi:4-oxalocrotonate tautomerase family enzyme